MNAFYKAMRCALWILRQKNISFRGVFWDSFTVKTLNQIELTNYFLGNLHQASCSLEERKKFLGYQQLLALTDELNPKSERSLCKDKAVQKQLVADAGVPVPSSFGFLHAQKGKADTGEPLRSLDDVKKLLVEHNRQRCVLKPLAELGGHGFRILDLTSANEVRSPESLPYFIHVVPSENGAEKGRDDLLPYLAGTGYICEEYVEQHDALAAINPYSLNTLRVWTYRSGQPDDSVSVLGTFLRTATGKTPVDNTSAGGIVARVEKKNGTLYGDFFSVDKTFSMFPAHPLSGLCCHGHQLPCWQEVMRMAEKIALAYKTIRLLAIDIAITPDGPVCIETNDSGDYQGQYLIQYGFGNLPEGQKLLAASAAKRGKA